MSTERKDLDIEDERTAEKRYAKALQEQASRPISYDGPRNLAWTRDGLPPPRKVAVGPLVGHIALMGPDEMLGNRNDFYIGEGKSLSIDGIEVYNWANPIACSFYRENHNHESHNGLGQLCDEVAVIRTLIRDNGGIVGFTDDLIRDDAPDQPFRKRGLLIPAPPHRPSLPARDVPKPPEPALTDDETPAHEHPSETPEDRQGGRVARDGASVRAEAALRAQLQAPRTKNLAPVLATLQPDQYELVTVPAMDSMIIDGKPGTGKTIIASHRVAYLVNDETPAENTLDGKVLLIGPTPRYSDHVIDVVARLAGNSERIIVLSVPELLRRILGLKALPAGPISTTWRDVDWELARFARRVAVRLRTAKGVTPSTEEVYESLRQNMAGVAQDPEWASYLRGLPPYKDAFTRRAHSPLLAFIRWEVARPADLEGVEHVIVDEAQDVSPLTWFLLDEINEADAWTILGDLNQRRSDHTVPSWEQVLEVIAIDPDTPIRELKRGYRSTRPILEFASRVLPRGERAVFAFQDEGPAPTVEKTRPGELGTAVTAQVDRLLTAYPRGTVAVIGADLAAVTKGLRATGWAMSRHNSEVWEGAGREVAILDPDAARGVEFDAVIVVEPVDFRQNYGRQGPLYTALTRANRELVVVYSKSLPDALRRR